MTKIRRLDSLQPGEQVVVGKLYLAPCVFVKNHLVSLDGWQPVLLPAHEDREFIGFATVHYHHDLRFVPPRQYDEAVGILRDQRLLTIRVVGKEVQTTGIEWRRRKCHRLAPLFPTLGEIEESFGNKVLNRWPIELEDAYEDRRLNCATMVCPHKGVCLTGHPVDERGHVVCPGHGLKWNTKTGELVRRHVRETVPASKPLRFPKSA